MKEAYKNGQTGFCVRCYESSIYKGFERADGSLGGLWWHEIVGNTRFCHVTNWPEGIILDPAEAEKGRERLKLRERAAYARFGNRRSQTDPIQPTTTQIISRYIPGGPMGQPIIPAPRPKP